MTTPPAPDLRAAELAVIEAARRWVRLPATGAPFTSVDEGLVDAVIALDSARSSAPEARETVSEERARKFIDEEVRKGSEAIARGIEDAAEKKIRAIALEAVADYHDEIVRLEKRIDEGAVGLGNVAASIPKLALKIAALESQARAREEVTTTAPHAAGGPSLEQSRDHGPAGSQSGSSSPPAPAQSETAEQRARGLDQYQCTHDNNVGDAGGRQSWCWECIRDEIRAAESAADARGYERGVRAFADNLRSIGILGTDERVEMLLRQREGGRAEA